MRNLVARSIVELAIETAMRRSEILSLQWQNVYLSDRYVRLRDTKNGEARDVLLTKRAVQVLEGLPREREGPVFPTSADAVKKAFERAVKRAAIGDLHFHDLRHEGTNCLAEKLDNVLEL